MLKIGFIIAATLVAYACASDYGTPKPVIKKGDATTELDRIMLWGLHGGNGSENVFYSPTSIRTALTELYMAAGGDTAKELSFILGLGNRDKETVAKEMRKFLDEEFRVATSGGMTMRQATGVFVDSKHTLNSEFRNTSLKNFDADVQNVQFRASYTAAKTINKWLAERTDNKITNLVDSKSLESSVAAMLVNAIYLKGAWKTPFIAVRGQRAFYNSMSEEVMTDFVYGIPSDCSYWYFNDLNASAVQIPFNDSSLSMLILLPKERDGIRDLERKLAGLDLNSIASNLKPMEVSVVLPKFQIAGSADLKSILTKLNMKHIFSHSADFRYLLEKPEPIEVKDIQHAANINVDEYGIEAAAATVTTTYVRGGMESFEADHPFLFFIRNEKTTFFAGRVGSFKGESLPVARSSSLGHPPSSEVRPRTVSTTPTYPKALRQPTPSPPRRFYHRTTEEPFIFAD